MSAINSALATIDRIGADGDMDANVTDAGQLRPGRSIRPDRAARRKADLPAAAVRRADRRGGMQADRHRESGCQPVPSADRTARNGQVVRSPGPIAYKLWRERGREVEERHGRPFYGLTEMQVGPASDEFTFRYDFVPAADDGGKVKLVHSALVTAMRRGRARHGRRGQLRARAGVVVDQLRVRRPPLALPSVDRPDDRGAARIRSDTRVQPRCPGRH